MLIRSVLWWFTISMIVFGLSTIAVIEVNQIREIKNAAIEKAHDGGNEKESALSPSLLYAIFLGCGILIGCLARDLYKRKHANRKAADGIFDVFFSRQTIHDCLAAIGIAVALSLAALLFLLPLMAKPHWLNWGVALLTNPGGLFALITGTGTLVGTYIAVQSILEMKHTITSYPQLLDRLTDLVDNADSSVKAVVVSPLPGWWQVGSEALKNGFIKAVERCDRRIEIICLDQADHMDLLLTIASRGTDQYPEIDENKVGDFQRECDRLLRRYAGTDQYPSEEMRNAHGKLNACVVAPVRVPYSSMHYFYFFVSEHKAIIVTPVGLPRNNKYIKRKACEHIIDNLNSIPADKKVIPYETLELIKREISSLKLKGKEPRSTVETLGFETSDHHIIERLQREFDDLKNKAVRAIEQQTANGK
jgi:hypothetical protein